ncbi:MAG: hypothetical protein AAF518_02650 [Spirochaetota bacterium]
MEIVTIATEWAKAEVFSSKFFILFGILFISASIGFWQWGKTDVAKAFIYPTLVCGILLLAVGSGILIANRARVTGFVTAYKADPAAFVKSEITRTEKSKGEFRTIVFKIIPLIITAAALLIILTNAPIWRAISITTIAMLVVILFVDSNANARIESYQNQLKVVDK